MKPATMNMFDYLFLSAVILEIFTVIAGWDYIVLEIHSQVWTEGGGPEMQLFMSGVAPWLIAISFLASFALWAFIAVFRFNPFRYVLAAFVGLEVLWLILDYFDPAAYTGFLLAGMVTTGLKVAATVFVFRTESGEWIRGEV